MQALPCLQTICVYVVIKSILGQASVCALLDSVKLSVTKTYICSENVSSEAEGVALPRAHWLQRKTLSTFFLVLNGVQTDNTTGGFQCCCERMQNCLCLERRTAMAIHGIGRKAVNQPNVKTTKFDRDYNSF